MSFGLAHEGRITKIGDSKISSSAKHQASALHSSTSNSASATAAVGLAPNSLSYVQRALGNDNNNHDQSAKWTMVRSTNASDNTFSSAREINNNLQPKLKVSQPGDIYEQEADKVADQIMMMAPSTVLTSRPSSDNEISSRCNSCNKMKDEEKGFKKLRISRKPSSVASKLEASDDVTNEINNIHSSSGFPLDTSTKGFMESRFGGGYDFSIVRIHADAQAAKSAESVNALAYSIGNHIMFGQGQYSPNTIQGKRLLAHELTHVIQQNSVRASSNVSQIDSNAIEISRAPGPTGRTFGKDVPLPSGEILRVMEEMDTELDELRKSMPPSISKGQEAQRTFCIVKVVDEKGAIKQSANGAFMGGKVHAENEAVSKLNIDLIEDTDTVLVIVDQHPCGKKCSPMLHKFKMEIKGGLRVINKVGVDPVTRRVTKSPKTARLKGDKSNQEILENQEYSKSTAESKGGKKPASPEKIPTPQGEGRTPVGKVTTTTGATSKTTISKVSSEASAETRATAKAIAKEVAADLKVGRTAALLGKVAKVMSVVSALQMIFDFSDFTDMAKGALAGEGYVLRPQIKQARQARDEASNLEKSYDEFGETIETTFAKLFAISKDPFSAGSASSSLADLRFQLEKMKNDLPDKISDINKVLLEARAKRLAALTILKSPELSGMIGGFTFGTGELARLFGVSEDLAMIISALESARTSFQNVQALLESDIEGVTNWEEQLFEICEKEGLCSEWHLDLFFTESRIRSYPAGAEDTQ
jgi:Domain of unknown function (DUF4157)